MNVKTIASAVTAGHLCRVNRHIITLHISSFSSFDNILIYINNHEIPLGQSFKDISSTTSTEK